MNRENATKIARRILDRVEQDRALHLDAIVDEILAGFALVEPMVTKRGEPSDEYKRALEQLEIQRQMERVYRTYTSDNTGPIYGQSPAMQAGIYGIDCYGQQTARIADDSIGLGASASIVIGEGKITSVNLTKAGDYTTRPQVTHHESDPISGYRVTPCDGPVKARDNPMGYSHAYCYGRWTQQQMLDAGYRNDVESRCYTPK